MDPSQGTIFVKAIGDALGDIVFWFLLAVTTYTAWIAATSYWSRTALNKIEALREENVLLRAEIELLKKRVPNHPLSFMERVKT